MSKVLQHRRGATLNFDVETDDPNALSALFVMKESIADPFAVLSKEVSFEDQIAKFDFSTFDMTIDLGDYVYTVSFFYLDGTVEKIYPNNFGCIYDCLACGDGVCQECDVNCSLPHLMICDSLKTGVS